MAEIEFFPQRPKVSPTIYVYELDGVQSHKGFLKVGYTERSVEERISEQLHTSAVPYKILFKESSVRADGTVFTDKDVHKILKRNGIEQLNADIDKNEWFKCSIEDVIVAIKELKTGIRYTKDRINDFKMRPEQTRAVQRTMDYFKEMKQT